MKPLALKGHERAITQIKYNRDGDLLFSIAKDARPTVWWSENGERVGTYEGHSGALWCIDVSLNSTLLLTGSADNTARLWDCELGKCLRIFESKSAVRTCGFSMLGGRLMYSTDTTMGQACELVLYEKDSEEPIFKLELEGSNTKITAAQWGLFDERLITAHEDGEVRLYDTRKLEKPVKRNYPHKDTINDLQFNKDKTMFITASRDHMARLIDSDSLEHLKVYRTERPVNSASISPLKDHVVLGGGQEAAEVTTTGTKAGKFMARFFHLVFEEEIGRVKGHFGPINTVAFHPHGTSYSSGGEDGYVRVHEFDPSYFEFEYDYDSY